TAVHRPAGSVPAPRGDAVWSQHAPGRPCLRTRRAPRRPGGGVDDRDCGDGRAGRPGRLGVTLRDRRGAIGRGHYDEPPVRYPVEDFTNEEQRLPAPHFTTLDRPVFALVNLPETIKGALFARYSRYAGTLRRLYLEEFAADVPAGGRPFEGEEGERAAGLY